MQRGKSEKVYVLAATVPACLETTAEAEPGPPDRGAVGHRIGVAEAAAAKSSGEKSTPSRAEALATAHAQSSINQSSCSASYKVARNMCMILGV